MCDCFSRSISQIFHVIYLHCESITVYLKFTLSWHPGVRPALLLGRAPSHSELVPPPRHWPRCLGLAHRCCVNMNFLPPSVLPGDLEGGRFLYPAPNPSRPHCLPSWVPPSDQQGQALLAPGVGPV